MTTPRKRIRPPQVKKKTEKQIRDERQAIKDKAITEAHTLHEMFWRGKPATHEELRQAILRLDSAITRQRTQTTQPEETGNA